MTTKVTDAVVFSDYTTIEVYNTGLNTRRVHLVTKHDGVERGMIHDRAQFLAAIEKEFDVLTIPRGDIPKVVDGKVPTFGGGSLELWGNDTPECLRTIGLAYLALSEYLAANPPIDEAQVTAIAALFPEIDEAHDATWYASRLVEAGVRAPEVTA